MEWLKNGARFSFDARVYMATINQNETQVLSTLWFSRLAFIDNGVYQCKGRDLGGNEAQAEIRVTVTTSERL